MSAGTRHSSNTNDRGNTEQRRKRKNWLLETFAADVDVVTFSEWIDLIDALFDETRHLFNAFTQEQYWRPGAESGYVAVIKGLGRPACRCFRCGKLLTYETMEVDKIVSKATKTKKYPNGGTYARENIRPCCCDCNKTIAGEERRRRNAKRKKRNEQARARRAAAKSKPVFNITITNPGSIFPPGGPPPAAVAAAIEMRRRLRA